MSKKFLSKNEPNWKGLQVRDVVSGIKGIVTGKAEYITGCTQYGMQPAVSKEAPTKMPDWYWVDCTRLEIIGDAVKLASPEALAEAPGGPCVRVSNTSNH